MTSGGYDPNQYPQGGQPHGQPPYLQGGQQPQYRQQPQHRQQPQYGQQPPDPYAQPYPQRGYGQQQPGYRPGLGGQPGDLGARIGARVIDHLIVGIPVGIICGLIFGSSISTQFITGIVAGVVLLAYFVGLEVSQGQTLGKKILGLKVIAPGGATKIDPQTSLKRNLYVAASIIPCAGGLIALGLAIYIMVTISQDPNKQGWHDKFAGGTQVVKG